MNNTGPLAIHLKTLAETWKNFPAVFFRQDDELRYIWVYNAFPEMTTNDMLGQTDTQLFPAAAAEQVTRLKRAVMLEKEPRYAVVRYAHAGAVHGQAVHWWVSPLFAEDGAIAGVGGLAVVLADAPAAGYSDRAELLASLSRAFTEAGNDYTAILETVVRLLARTAGEASAIQLFNEEGRDLIPAALCHSDPKIEESLRALFQESLDETLQTLMLDVLTTSLPLMVEDLSARDDLLSSFPPALAKELKKHPVHSAMALPLRTPRGVLGILCIWRSRSKEVYGPDDLVFWQDVVDRAALAIEYARLYAVEVRRNRQLKALHDATTALLSTLDLETLLGQILDSAQVAIPAAEHGVLHLVAPQTGRLEVRATSGFKDPRIRHTGPLHDTNARQAMRERRPVLIRDAALLDGFENRAGQDAESVGSAIFAPLVMGDEVLGTLSLSASKPNAFNQSDLQLLVSFAVTTTAALHNAMLHTELQQIAITDPLTMLYNRRGLLEFGRHEIDRFQRFGKPLSAIMLDIDHFKGVNDTYGHPAGDQVLRRLAERCRKYIRIVDVIGRYGGEEFAILLPETDLFQAVAIAERLRSAVESEPFPTDQGPVSITVSMGVSRVRPNAVKLEALIDQIDAAMYQAKQKGRNRVEVL